MKSVFSDRRRLYPAAAVVLALLVLIPLLGRFGLWDPHEISIADEARKLVSDGSWDKVAESRPPLTTWLIATSISILGPSELAARLPLALFGVLATIMAYCLGARISRPRAGLFAAIALLTSPLFLFQSRQLTSDVAAVACQAGAVLGLIGLAWPRGGRYQVALLLADLALALVSLLLGYFASGVILGVIAPIAGVGIASAIAVGSRFEEDYHDVRLSQTIFASICAALVIGALACVFFAVFEWKPAQPGQWQIGGETLVASKKFQELLGGAWRAGEPPATATFDWILDQVIFGMFPWSALAPIALLRLAWPVRRDRKAWGGVVLLGWTTAAYFLSALFVRRVTEVRFAALAAVAVAIGVLLDDLLAAKAEGRVEEAPYAASGLPLAGLFVGAATFQLARDVVLFPDELASVHLLKAIKYPVEMKLWLYGIAALGAIFGAFAVAALVARGARSVSDVVHRRAVEIGVWGVAGTALALGFYLSFAYTPKLSEHFSYRNIFESYFDHRAGAEPLGVMGIPGSGPEYYARGPFERLTNQAQLNDFLEQDARVFAITPADKLCAVNQSAAQGGFSYHVLDNRNSRFLLLTNRLGPNEKDENPLVNAFAKTPPAKVAREVRANFENKLELIGVDMPDEVDHGDKFKVTLWFKVLQRPGTNYKILLHFDGPSVRFQGDHDPIDNRCGTTYWQPGDYVKDETWVTAGEITHPRGNYEVFTGFFTGGGGQWKNMNVVEGPKGADNRVPLGRIRVK